MKKFNSDLLINQFIIQLRYKDKLLGNNFRILFLKKCDLRVFVRETGMEKQCLKATKQNSIEGNKVIY